MLQKGVVKLAVLIFITCFFSVAILAQFRAVSDLQHEEEKILSELAKEEELKESLNETLESYDTDAFVEEVAREQLGFIEDDEIVFIVQ